MKTSNNVAGRPRSVTTTHQLHAAFWRLLETTPFNSISMERIAAEARVSRPALYRRYMNVAELTLAALLEAGREQILLNHSSDLADDLQRYFTSLVRSLDRNGVVGRALRILLAKAQTDEILAASFRDFLTQRREPVRLRIQAEFDHYSSKRLEQVLDQLFGPILYRLLIRNLEVDEDAVRVCIASGLGGL